MPVVYKGVEYRAADAHTHIYPEKVAEKATASVGRFYGLEMRHVGLPEILKETGEAAGIDRFLVCSVATKPEQVESINSFIQKAVADNQSFVGLGAWHQDLQDVEAGIDSIIRRGLRGVKLHPDFQGVEIDSPKLTPFYRAAARERLPVLFHTGDSRMDFSSPQRLLRVLWKTPELICTAAHLGGYTQWSQARECLKGTGVYVDTSSSLPFLSKEEALLSIEAFGQDRVMFGTDFPMWTEKKELEDFFALGLSEEVNRRILYDNFASLYLGAGRG